MSEQDDARKREQDEAAHKRDDAVHKRDEAARKRIAEESKAREQAHAEQRDASSAVKPTPTQAENDLAASGVHVVDKEPDGSPPDPGVQPTMAYGTRQVEAKPTGRANYPTRQSQPQS